MLACVKEDFLRMGDQWKQKAETAQHTDTAKATVLNRTPKATTAKEVIQQQLNLGKQSDQSVQSF